MRPIRCCKPSTILDGRPHDFPVSAFLGIAQELEMHGRSSNQRELRNTYEALDSPQKCPQKCLGRCLHRRCPVLSYSWHWRQLRSRRWRRAPDACSAKQCGCTLRCNRALDSGELFAAGGARSRAGRRFKFRRWQRPLSRRPRRGREKFFFTAQFRMESISLALAVRSQVSAACQLCSLHGVGRRPSPAPFNSGR